MLKGKHEEYYRLNEILMFSIGLWPYQSVRSGRLMLAFILFINWSILPPMLIKMAYSLHNYDLFLECLTPFSTQLMCDFKIGNYMLNVAKLKQLTDSMQRNWAEVETKSDLEVFEKFAGNSKWVTKVYAIYIFSTALLYCAIPLTPQILDLVKPLNESRPKVYALQVEYFVDNEKYFGLIWLHALIIALGVVTILVSVDTMYMTFVEHVCGLFTVISNRLRNLSKLVESEGAWVGEADEYIRAVGSCVALHNKAIKFADLVESAHTSAFLPVIAIDVVLLSAAGVQVVTKTDEPETFMRFAIFTVAHTIHLFCLSFPAQRLMDHSMSVACGINQADWYKISTKAQKMLILIIMRSKKPSNITAGKLYVLSSESFCSIMKATMSYFTVLSSAH